MIACGGSEKKTTAGNYGSLKYANLPTDEQTPAAVTLTSVASCTHDANSNLFTASFSSGSTAGALDIKIKGMTRTDASYTCSQAADNKTENSVGFNFNICSVSTKTAQTNGNLNAYSIYREAASEADLDYSGVCTIDISYLASTISGKISCSKMIQTSKNNRVRYPYDNSITLDIASGSTFECSIK